MKASKRLQAMNCTSHHLRMATRAVTQYYDSRLRPSGLRGTQFTVLAAVGEDGPIPITALAKGLMMDRTTLTRDIKPLQKKGLVSVKEGSDRRVRLLSLSEEGQRALEAAAPLWEAAQEEIYQSLGKKTWKRLMDDLGQTAQTAAVGKPK